MHHASTADKRLHTTCVYGLMMGCDRRVDGHQLGNPTSSYVSIDLVLFLAF